MEQLVLESLVYEIKELEKRRHHSALYIKRCIEQEIFQMQLMKNKGEGRVW